MEIEDIHILLKMLKHASLEGHLHFISFIINNSEKIKFLDNFKIYDYSMKSILNKTLLQVFNIKNWTSLVETAIINDNIYNLFIKNEKQEVPSYEIMIATYDIFSIVYNEPLQDTILHVLSSTSDNYMLYCMTQWLKESKKDKMDLKISLNQTNLKMFNDLMNSEKNDNQYQLFAQINFQKFKNNENWSITNYPIYYKEMKTYAIGICYDGMGWYNVLSISLLPKNTEKQFFFSLDGGSSGIDHEMNDKFFRTKQPPFNKMFNLEKIIEHLTKNTFKHYLFAS
jgi:hypothetical protein